MDLKEHFKARIALLKELGYEVTETDQQITAKDEERTYVYSLDKEAEKYMAAIKEITILFCEKNYEKGLTIYKLQFEYNEKSFMCQFRLAHKTSYLIESLNIKTRIGMKTLYANMKDTFKKEEVLVLKEIILRFRSYITNQKEHRLRLLFKPLRFGESYDWILNA